MKYLIAPSILSANLANLGEDVTNVINAGADIVHFDVMDNHYVPNLTFGPSLCKALRNYGITADIDVHLMVENVDSLIPQFADAGANYISIHPEGTKHLDRSLSLIRTLGCKAGLAINPATSLNVLEHVLDKIDFILLMSVNPGFGGQKFIPRTLHKIKEVKSIIEASNYDIQIEVDGGINLDNIAMIKNAGASMFVAGNAIFNQDNYEYTIQKMRKELEKHPVEKVKAIAFDLDGTLIDSASDIYLAANLSLEELNLPLCSESQIRSLIGKGIRSLSIDILKSKDISDPKIIDRLIELLNKNYMENYVTTTKMYPGVFETISKLKKNGYKLGLVTNKPYDLVIPIIKHFNLEFDIVLGADSLEKMKPDPLPILHLLKKWSLNPEQLLMIGDSKHDIEAAKAAKVISLAVTYGYNHNTPINESNPDFSIDSFSYLLNLLRI